MANMKDFSTAYKALLDVEGYNKDRNLRSGRDSWKDGIYYTAYIAGSFGKSGAISDPFPTPMEAVKDVIKKVEVSNESSSS